MSIRRDLTSLAYSLDGMEGSLAREVEKILAKLLAEK